MSNDNEGSAPAPAPRRSLFPSSYAKQLPSKKNSNAITFSPYARSLKIDRILCILYDEENLNDEENKAQIWWNKDDYDDFAKVGRIVSKAILQGGSEIWLKSKSSTPHQIERSMTGRSFKRRSSTTTTISTSNSNNNNANNNNIESKWWCRFGHSRRGLEHFASNMEGRQRQLNVRSAIRSVLEEQQRQKMFLPKGFLDSVKLRTAYLKETHWAKFLAHAAGESDADAVLTHFDDTKRKTREYYLKKNFDNCDHISIPAKLPIFMNTAVSKPLKKTKMLDFDANTASQIKYRKKQQTKCKVYDDRDDDIKKSSTSSIAEEINTLSKIAAGWGHDDDSSKPNTLGLEMKIGTSLPKAVVG